MRSCLRQVLLCCSLLSATSVVSQEVIGVTATPHTQSLALRWRRAPDPDLAARVELFIQNRSERDVTLTNESELLFDVKSPQQLLDSGAWAWHDTPSCWIEQQVRLPKNCLTVLAFNGKSADWGIGTSHQVQIDRDSSAQSFAIETPEVWLSAVTFLSTESSDDPATSIYPNQIVVHIRNGSQEDVQLDSLRLWLPEQEKSHHVFQLARESMELESFPSSGVIAASSRGGFSVKTAPLPLTPAVIEVVVRVGSKPRSLWAALRIKRESFDISGGWVASDINGRNSLTMEDYLKTLKRMHINTGQIEEVGGYTDNPELYARYPIKRFNRMQDWKRYDTDAMLPQIHAVEFLGEPQFGGGKPVAPQEVWKQLAPYQSTRLPTTVTLSEERTWRYYAGLSDYPHYDAYRVIAPAADSWRSYDRWDGQQIRWGAPLETIGDLTRSLRELNRPRPIAYWSQGAHDGWGSFLSKRRRSPTADELRSQAWHGLANRITSLYWFNLSLKSLTKFPDLIEPITGVNREIRLIDDILLAGDAFEYRRVEVDGKPSWDLNSIASSQSALLVAHDLAYRADAEQREFKFTHRDAKLAFALPNWLEAPLQVFRIDANGTHPVNHSLGRGIVTIEDRIQVCGVYIATSDPRLRAAIDAEAADLVSQESELGFDPGKDPEDLQALKQLLQN